MTNDEIKELIRVVQETGIAELEVHRTNGWVRIKSSSSPTQEMMVPAVLPLAVSSATPIMAAAPIQPALPPQETPAVSSPAAEPNEGADDAVIKSPIVGTYYDAPAPGEPPFVKIGDRVEPKQILCIIESMKLMNEIEADIAGVITAKFIDNGRPVEYAESLFTIRPVGS